MIIMLCGSCQMDMFLDGAKYYSDGGSKYHMVYTLVDENNHKAEIKSNIKDYDPESAEARLIQSLIEHTERMESI